VLFSCTTSDLLADFFDFLVAYCVTVFTCVSKCWNCALLSTFHVTKKSGASIMLGLSLVALAVVRYVADIVSDVKGT